VLALVDSGWTELKRAVEAGDPAIVAEVQRRADAIRYLSKKAKLAIGAVNAAARLKTDAEWNAGRMLRDLERGQGSRTDLQPNNNLVQSSPYAEALRDADLARMQAHRWEDMSRVDRHEIDLYYKSQEEKQAEIASSAIAHMGARARRMEKITEKQSSYEKTPPDERPVPVIYADPPWRYEHAISDSRKIENQYPTMTTEEIAAVDPAPEEDAVLFLWATSPKLQEGMQILEAWGFTYRTSMVWVKPQIGMGYYARSQHELLLIGALGSLPMPLPENRPSSVIDGRRTEHSAKPDLRPVIDSMYPGLWKREMFSRRPADGLWLTHGYERNRP
jgi:N6-adenosine-specific RNA methylase IME4